MTRVITCPDCAALSAVPALAPNDALAICPSCNAQIALADAVRTLRIVTLIETIQEPSLHDTPFSSQATLPDSLTDLPTLSNLFERFHDISHSSKSPAGESSSFGTNNPGEAVTGLDETLVAEVNEINHDPFDFDTSELGIERQAEIEYQPHALENTDPLLPPNEYDREDRAFVAEVISVAEAQQRRSRRGGSIVRQLFGVVGGGVIGLTLGYFALLWWRGPEGDMLGLANRIPVTLLPASFDDVLETKRTAPQPAPSPREPLADFELATYADTAPPATTLPPEVHEPLPFESPEALPLFANVIVQNAPTYSPEQLSAALIPAMAAREKLVAGSLSDPASRRSKGESYVKFCQVAETLTFLTDHSDTVTAATSQTAWQLFESLLQDAATRAEIGQLALRWIDYPSRSQSGIFLAGTVLSSKPAGSVHELQIELPGGDVLMVLTPNAPILRSTAVGIVGSIIEKPSDCIPGYGGLVDRAIWSQKLLPLK